MKIREMLEREKYINDTIDKFAKRIRGMESMIGWEDSYVKLNVNEARQIAECLDWLKEIFTQNINSLSVYEVSIESLPKMRE